MLNSKKITSAVLIAALASSSLVVAPHAAEAKTFNDVPRSHWAYGVIDEVSDANIMNGIGNGLFSPDGQLTRAQSTTILYNMAPDKSIGQYHTTFNDVAANAWYKDIAQWGVSNAIIFTQGPGIFAGEQLMDRQNMAFIVFNFLEKYYPKTLDKNIGDLSYADQHQITDNMEEAVLVLSHNKILNGCGNNAFAPKAILTRAEASAIASRVKKFVANSSVNPEHPPVTPEQPQKPEQPPVEEGHRAPGDENAPAWMVEIPGVVDGKEQTIYIHKPDSFNASQWEELKEFYKDKERPSDYPDYISSDIRNPQAYMIFYLEDLYKDVQRTKAKTALEAGTVSLTAEEQKMVDLVNAQRRKAGVPELIVSPALCQAAKIRAAEANNKYSHERPNGTSAETVIDDLGIVYPFIDSIGGTHGEAIAYTENLAGNYGAKPMSAQHAFSKFMNSTGHRENMLRENKVYIGVASVSNGKECAWIQSFGYIQ